MKLGERVLSVPINKMNRIKKGLHMNLMNNSIIQIPEPTNEPVYDYAPGSKERQKLEQALQATASSRLEIPLIIGGKEVTTGDIGQVVMPHNHNHVLERIIKQVLKRCSWP